MYRGWDTYLPDTIEPCPVELPGRGARFDEPPISEMSALVDHLLPGVESLVDRPYAIFGHSMGAKIGHALACVLAKRGWPPVHFFVAASPAPHVPRPRRHDLPRAAFISMLRGRGGTPPEVLEDTEFMDIVIPTLRADFRLADEYVLAEAPALTCPLTAFAGTSDPDISVANVAEWRRHTSARFRFVEIDAGHFFISSHREQVLTEIVRDLG